jgi:hypothetical protein
MDDVAPASQAVELINTSGFKSLIAYTDDMPQLEILVPEEVDHRCTER